MAWKLLGYERVKAIFVFISILSVTVTFQGQESGATEILQPNILILPENHQEPKFRSMEASLIRQIKDLDCLFKEDSPELDATYEGILAGKLSVTEYRRRWFSVGRKMGYSDDDNKRAWDQNMMGSEQVLEAAKDMHLKVFAVDYSSTESKGAHLLKDSDSIYWNYEVRHNIMAKHIFEHRLECKHSLFIVGEPHVDPQRILELNRRVHNLDYRDLNVKPISEYLRQKGFSVSVLFPSFKNFSGDSLFKAVLVRDMPHLDEVEENDFQTIGQIYRSYRLFPHWNEYNVILFYKGP